MFVHKKQLAALSTVKKLINLLKEVSVSKPPSLLEIFGQQIMFFDSGYEIPSLPNTLWVGVWAHKHLLRRPLGGPNTYSQGIWRILED